MSSQAYVLVAQKAGRQFAYIISAESAEAAVRFIQDQRIRGTVVAVTERPIDLDLVGARGGGFAPNQVLSPVTIKQRDAYEVVIG